MLKENISLCRRITDKKNKKGVFYLKDKYPLLYIKDGKKFIFHPEKEILAGPGKATFRFSTGIEFQLKVIGGETLKAKGRIEVTNIKEANRYKLNYIEQKRNKFQLLEKQELLDQEERTVYGSKLRRKLVSELPGEKGLFDDYLMYRTTNFRKKITNGTKIQYLKSVKSFVKRVGNKYLHEYTVEDCREYIATLREEPSKYSQSGIKDMSAKKYFDNLNRIFKWAIQNEYFLKENHWENSTVRQEVFIKKRQVLSFSPDQFKEIYSQINNQQDKNFILWALLTGMRPNEIAYLKVEDVSIMRKTIHIRSNEEHRTKTDRPRKLPLALDLINIVKNALQKKQIYVFENHRRKVIDERTGKPDIKVNYAKISNRFKNVVLQVIPGSLLSLYNLRSSFGSWLLEEGSTMEKISKLLGHQDISTTQRHYADCAAVNFTTEVNMISKILKRTSEKEAIQIRFKGKWKYNEEDLVNDKSCN